MAKRRTSSCRLSGLARKRLIEAIEACGLTRKRLADAATCSVPTIKNVLNTHYNAPFKRTTLQNLCKAVGTTLERIESKIAPRAARSRDLYDFSDLASTLAEIDSAIMPIIRGANADPAAVSSTYNDLMKLHTDRHGLELERLCTEINTIGFWSNSFLPFPKPTLSIHVSDKLESISYTTDSATLTVPSPRLMRDCLCADRNKPDRNCPIHSNEIGTEVLTRFDSGINRLQFMGTTTYFRLEKSLWPPSMDSLVMASKLKECGVFVGPFRRVLDLGSGTGFLGLTILKQNPSVYVLHLSDWLLSPLLWGSFNWIQNRKNRENVEVKAILGRFGESLPKEQLPYDLCLCNPPYLLENEASPDLNMRSAVYGTQLLRYVISNHKQLANQVYMQFSKIALEEAQKECAKAGARLVSVGKPTSLPFRPSYQKLDEDYLRLLETRGLLVDPSLEYPYWHEVQLYKVTDANRG